MKENLRHFGLKPEEVGAIYSSIPVLKENIRKELADDIQQFLESGGKIEKVDIGVSGQVVDVSRRLRAIAQLHTNNGTVKPREEFKKRKRLKDGTVRIYGRQVLYEYLCEKCNNYRLANEFNRPKSKTPELWLIVCKSCRLSTTDQ